MDKIKQAKLIELRNKKNINNKKSDLARHTELIESINKLHSLFEDNGSTNTDKLLNKLNEFSVFKSDITKIKESIANLKIDNVSIDNFSELIKLRGDIDFTQVINSINKLSKTISENTVDSVTIKNKDTSEYIPVRRVRQIQNRLVFDDDPLQVNVVGGGGGYGLDNRLNFNDAGQLEVDANFSGDIEIGDVQIKNVEGNIVNPATSENQINGSQKTQVVNDLINFEFDSVYGAYPDSVTEVYTYKLNGEIVKTITIIYANIDKKELISCVRS